MRRKFVTEGDSSQTSRSASEASDRLGEVRIRPNPSLTRLIEHIQTIDSYENSAKIAVDELEEDDDDGKIRGTIDTTNIFGSTVITEAEDIEPPIDELRDEIGDLLNQEGDGEIRFR